MIYSSEITIIKNVGFAFKELLKHINSTETSESSELQSHYQQNPKTLTGSCNKMSKCACH